MITKELITRINELSRKQRSTGLTEEEKKEQKNLREIYLEGIRGQMRQMLDNIEIVDDPRAAAGMQAPLSKEPRITHINEVAINLRPYVN
ncbi:hypothetical protein SELR_03260 [Selenomonas ruminantium subsp. lactilytica TAM6421]|uniref:UPF0291 protein SELR_03260 n=1 Tax=Selenomonas ruminantium subsp. lactilytica (strain NBRC 103574 / TAM6421) TaxID=927704 RepID=I0GMP7_SELRL|nr:DUF896 domain-containing protein [Selenomonas ruminantium]BAL82034.1 hypothetical protein SELR_03260 [Selenomonas ruminantium subsp. lactilytica TAM6421]